MSYRVMGLMLTYRCTAQCKMCITESSPARKEELSLEDGFHFIDQAKEFDLLISIAGGEPFLLLDKLQALVEHAAAHGLTVCCVTNAYWATSHEKSLRTFKDLKDRGLTMVKVSVDDFHQEFIPMEHVANAIRAGIQAGLQVQIQNTCTSVNKDTRYYAFCLKAFHNVDISKVGANEDTRLPIGRCSETYPEQDFKLFEELRSEYSRCFKELIVDITGEVLPCCNPLIAPIGNLKKDSLKTILERAQSNFYFNLFKEKGPVSFARMLEKEKGISLSKLKFVNECHLCTYLFSIPEVCTLFQSPI